MCPVMIPRCMGCHQKSQEKHLTQSWVRGGRRAREWFSLLRIREGFLEEMFKMNPKGSTGANKTKDGVGKAFLAVGTVWTKKWRRAAAQERGGFIFKKGLAAENIIWECVMGGRGGRRDAAREHILDIGPAFQSLVFHQPTEQPHNMHRGDASSVWVHHCPPKSQPNDSSSISILLCRPLPSLSQPTASSHSWPSSERSDFPFPSQQLIHFSVTPKCSFLWNISGHKIEVFHSHHQTPAGSSSFLCRSGHESPPDQEDMSTWVMASPWTLSDVNSWFLHLTFFGEADPILTLPYPWVLLLSSNLIHLSTVSSNSGPFPAPALLTQPNHLLPPSQKLPL